MNRSYSKIRHIQESNQKLERRILNEQDNVDSRQYVDDDFDFENGRIVFLKRYSSKQVKRAISNLPENVVTILFVDCEYADFNGVNLCDFSSLKAVNLKDTPNNLEETQDSTCFEKESDNEFFFNRTPQKKDLHVGPLEIYGGWHGLQEYLEKKGNPDYVYDGDLFLQYQKNIDTLGTLVRINGTLNLMNTYVTSLGGLKIVTGSVGLYNTELNNLGHLIFIGGDLHLSKNSPLLKRYSEEEIRDMVKIDGKIKLL